MLSQWSSSILTNVRALAALSVFIAHASYISYSGPYAGFAVEYAHLGHLGVIVFFVLSGFVIAYVCDEKHCTLNGYMVARVSRLSIVLLPAIAVTWLLDWYGYLINAETYENVSDFSFYSVAAKGFVVGLFLHQSDIVTIKFLSNGPLWSIAYEFWYYAIFGFWFYTRGRARFFMLTLVVLLAGVKVLVLFPVWCFGAAAYYFFKQQRNFGVLSNRVICLLFVFLFFGIFFMESEFKRLSSLAFPENVLSYLGFSRNFIHDYFLGAAFALVLVSLLNLRLAVGEPSVLSRMLFGFSKMSFSVYAVHVPLLYFAVAIGYDRDSGVQAFVACCIVLAVSWLFYMACEQHYPQVRGVLSRLTEKKKIEAFR